MTYLERIVDAHREVAAADLRSLDTLLDTARALPPVRGFAATLSAREQIALIAEIKRRSPSKGDFGQILDPAELAVAYAEGGASCLSVLTDVEFFGGSAADLHDARQAVDLPVLRKDFTISPLDVADARLMGADCVLLIAAVLDELELVEFYDLATTLGLDVLVEVHDEPELERALQAGATLVGVNQRDLVSFHVDSDRAARVGAAIPDGVVKVAESGIGNADDVRRLADVGFDAVLVGETLVTAADPSAAARELLTR